MADIQLAAAIVVDDQNRVLIVQRGAHEQFLPGQWGVPCGKLNEGEEPERAAVRELLEETGVTGEVVGYGGSLTFESHRDGRKLRNVQRTYLVRPLSTTVRTPGGEEHDWLPVTEIGRPGLLDPHNQQAIQQGLAVRRRRAQAVSAASTTSSRAR
jgi:mutator protein MutT